MKVGYAYATMGQADKGVPLIEQGIAKGGLKRPDEAKLRLGMAQMKAGAKARGVQTLRTRRRQGRHGRHRAAVDHALQFTRLTPPMPGLDSETRASEDDHMALRLWLRLLACANLVEGPLRSRLREQFEGASLPRFDLMAQLERHPRGSRCGSCRAG